MSVLLKIAVLALVLAVIIPLLGIRNIANALIGKALWGFSWWNLPKIDGTILLNTSFPLHSNVKIVRDKFGIPHIYAEHSMDLIFGQGFVHAQERLWQMEIVRRVATGRLAEIIPEGLPADRLSRTFGFHRLGKLDVDIQLKTKKNPKTGELERSYVEAYVNGINAYIRSPEFKKPIEFTVLNIIPRHWTVDEVGAIARMLVWQMSRGWHFKIANFGLTQFASKFPTSASGANITESILKSIFDLTETDSPTTLPTGNVEINWDKFDDIVKDQPPTEQGSNAWTVSGKFTNGKPFLASDPHLAQSLPSVWYQNHLIVNSGGKTTLNVTGVTMPGIPFVQIGHNDRIAWGITLSYADVADIFLEKISKDKKTYEFKGEQKPIQEVEEVIFVKGQENPFIETVRLTHHGPIISGLVNYTDSPMEFAISATYLKDTLHVPMEVFFELNQAESVPKAREVLLNMGLLSLNIILADDQDNIGYQMTGEIPIRTQFAINHPNLPYAGWDGKAEWQGYLDIKQNPAAINPEQGYIISCNHRIVGPEYKHYLGNSFKYGSRAIRIKTMLTETLKRNNNRLTLRDFAKWQNDVHEPPSVYQAIVDLIKNNFDELSKFVPLKENITHDHYLRILQELRDFNGEMDKDSIGAGIYTVFVDQLFIRIMVKLGLEEKLWARIKGCGISPALFAVNEYFGHEVHTIEKLSHIPDIITNKDIYHAAVNTVFSLRNLLGLKQAPQDPHEVILTTGLWAHFMKQDRNMSMEEEFNMYKYGNYHQLVLQHAFGQRITEFNRGPYPHGGSPNTPNMGAPYPDGKNYAIKINASFRMLIDLGNVSDAISIFAPGQSGHLASKHYNDFTASFIRGQYNDMYFTSQVIEKNKEGTLTLVKK